MSNKTLIIAPAGIPQIVITRDFDAPAKLVYQAHIDPDLLPRWLGPRDLRMTVDHWEPRHGGRWRYVHTDPEGHQHGFHGVFHGNPTPAQIVQTFEYEGAPGHVKLDTLTLVEHDRTTTLRAVSTFPSVEDRDAMVASGMERGVVDSGDRLEQLLAQLATR